MRFPTTPLCPRLVVATVLVALALPAAQLAPRINRSAEAAGNCSTLRAAGSDSEEQSMLSIINTYRSQNGLSPLTASPSLSRAALWKSSDMAQNQYFAHDDLGRGWLQRLLDCGYPSSNDGEDLAAGNADAQHTFDQWRTSPPHNANLLNPVFHAIGVGRAELAGGQWYWTADFGPSVDADTAGSSGPGSPPPPPPAPSSRGSLAVGAGATVNTPNDCLRVHSAASMASSVGACLSDGASLTITGGPVQADGYTWWSITTGWVAGQYLKPPS